MLFFTKSGDEYIISQYGTEWYIDDIVKIFRVYMKYIGIKKMKRRMIMDLR